jgi:enoyl-CoA hydratase/carnithine racemase
MDRLTVSNRDGVAIITLNNGPTNAIHPELVEQLSMAVKGICREAKGLILRGNEKFFSIGFDLPTLTQLDRSGMANFWYAFNRLTLQLYTLPIPTISILTGHAVGGGHILALTTDFRYVAEDTIKKMGLNEMQLGLPVPFLADLIVRQLAGDRVASRLIYSGGLIPLVEGLPVGLIDELLPMEQLEQQAVDKIRSLMKVPPAFEIVKMNRTAEIKERYEANYARQNPAFIDCWFSDPVQEMLREAVKKF